MHSVMQLDLKKGTKMCYKRFIDSKLTGTD